jgi:hypothetical protein
MMRSDVSELPTCDRFDAEVRRFVSTAVSRPTEVEPSTMLIEPESEMRTLETLRRPWQSDAA